MFWSILQKSQYSFEGKYSEETVLALLYRHWFVLLTQAIFFGIMALAPFVLYRIGATFISLGIGYWFLVSLYFLFWWQSLFYRLTFYVLDVWVVTDHRIIDSEQHGFFQRTVSELNLNKIQDITVKISGITPTFLDYGDLEIQTAGTAERFIFKQIPHPNQVREMIMQAHAGYSEIHADEPKAHGEPA